MLRCASTEAMLLLPPIYKSANAQFFHTIKALTSYHVSATLIVIENGNNGLGYAG